MLYIFLILLSCLSHTNLFPSTQNSCLNSKSLKNVSLTVQRIMGVNFTEYSNNEIQKRKQIINHLNNKLTPEEKNTIYGGRPVHITNLIAANDKLYKKDNNHVIHNNGLDQKLADPYGIHHTNYIRPGYKIVMIDANNNVVREVQTDPTPQTQLQQTVKNHSIIGPDGVYGNGL